MWSARPAAQAFSPLDDELELLAGKLTPRLQEGLVHLGSWMPFARASELLQRFTGVHVSEATARRLTLMAGEAVVALDEGLVDWLEDEVPSTPQGPVLQQMSVDGAMVSLVGKDVWGEVRTVAIGSLIGDGEKARASELSYFPD